MLQTDLSTLLKALI